MTKPFRKQNGTGAESPEISLDTLQRLSFELIAKSVQLWRSYRDDDKGKGTKIA
jgi:hypothetical protein